MLRHIYLLLVMPALLAIAAFMGGGPGSDEGWIYLFNGKDLSGWDTYLAPPTDSNGKRISDQPVGLNNDPQHVFTVVTDGGEKVIRISGEGTGAVITQKSYSDYHLQLQFRWGVLQWGAKKHKKKDSGLLYHSVGPYGADGGAWLRSHEFQVQEGDVGEYWGCAEGMADIPAVKKSDSVYVYDPAGQVYTFSVHNAVGRHCYKRGDGEHGTGEWNTLDLYCHGDTSVHVVNGKVMMVLYHLAQSDNGTVSPLTEGRIQLQSEGAEVFYKQIKIQPISQIPADVLK
jgi:Domain of Unknown Function (DUF1080)